MTERIENRKDSGQVGMTDITGLCVIFLSGMSENQYFFRHVRRCFHIISVLILLSSGCVSLGVAPEARKQGALRVIRNVPFFPQEDYQCGPASLASLLNYRGVSVTPDEVAETIYSRSAKGTLNMDMILYAQSRGLEASQYSGGLDDLREKIDSDQPLIVLVDYGFSVLQANHFMVVIGYGEGGVVANSGREEKKYIPMSDFLKSWKKTGYRTLLITNEK
jgi:predicted double-glycine peptidase